MLKCLLILMLLHERLIRMMKNYFLDNFQVFFIVFKMQMPGICALPQHTKSLGQWKMNRFLHYKNLH